MIENTDFCLQWHAISFVSFRFDLFRFVLFRFVSICFVSFRSVSFRFDLFRFVSICFVSFRFVSVSFRTLQGPTTPPLIPLSSLWNQFILWKLMKDGRTARHMFDQSNSLYPSASVLELVQISQHCATWFTCKRYLINFRSLALTAWNSGQTNGVKILHIAPSPFSGICIFTWCNMPHIHHFIFCSNL